MDQHESALTSDLDKVIARQSNFPLAALAAIRLKPIVIRLLGDPAHMASSRAAIPPETDQLLTKAIAGLNDRISAFTQLTITQPQQKAEIQPLLEDAQLVATSLLNTAELLARFSDKQSPGHAFNAK